MVKRAFTTWQMLRYPIVFGTCLAAYFTAFSLRNAFFKDEIDHVREKNLLQVQLSAEKIEAAKQEARTDRAFISRS